MTANKRLQMAAQAAELARRSLSAFAGLMEPKYESAPHTKLLCDRLEALERGDIRRLVVAMPPRHGKSMHVSQLLPAWFLGRNSSRQVIISSYAAELAERHSRRARDLVRSATYPFEARVSEDSSAVNRWATTNGGIVIATGVGGGLTGHGADLLIVDDPLRDAAEADSATARENLWEWFSTVARTRLMPNGRMLIAATRWHEDDLTGRVLDGDDAASWEVLSLPAIAEDTDDALGRKPGQALWPAWFPAESLPSVERGEFSSRQFAALYQQRPSPESGTIFQRTWLEQRYDDASNVKHVIQAIDSAWKTGVANDYSVIATWGIDWTTRHYVLLDIWRDKVEYPELLLAVKRMSERFKPLKILCEEAAAGFAIVAELRRSSLLPVVGVTPHGSKTMRAEAVTPLFESGHVALPKKAPWLDAWIDEHLRFPAGKHDDMVDTTSLALPALVEVAQRVRAAELQNNQDAAMRKRSGGVWIAR